MTERIKARVGDVIETSFKLAYKKAEVARLPDTARYHSVDFFMLCEAGGKVELGAGRELGPGTFIQSATKEVTQDDQEVSARFSFANTKETGDRLFVTGDLWKLFISYCEKDGNTSGKKDDTGTHLLAEVELVAAAAAAAGPPKPAAPPSAEF